MRCERETIEDLWRRVQVDKGVFPEFFEVVQKPMYVVAFRILQNRADAEDVVQDVFIQLLQVMGSKTIQSAYPYIMHAVHNRALNRLRNREKETLSEELCSGDRIQGSSKESVFFSEYDLLQDALKIISEEDQRILILHVDGELTFSEVGRICGMSSATAFRRYRKAVAVMRDYMNGGRKP